MHLPPSSSIRPESLPDRIERMDHALRTKELALLLSWSVSESRAQQRVRSALAACAITVARFASDHDEHKGCPGIRRCGGDK